MRRVVVTGLGMVTPLGCGVEPTWKRILAGQSGAKKIDTFEVSDLASQIACVIPRGDGTDGTFNPDQWMEPKDQRKVDDFIIFAMCAAKQALDDANWHPHTEDDQLRHRHADRLRHRRPVRHCRHRDPAERARPAQGVAVLHSRPPDQSRFRLCLDRARAEGPQSLRGHRVLDRRARDRRCRPSDRARRCRCDGRRRHRVADQPLWRWPASRRARALDQFQRQRRRRRRGPTTRIATVSSWARAPASWCSKNTSTPSARRTHLCRGHRLRHVGRCLSHHLADAGWRRRVPQHERRR